MLQYKCLCTVILNNGTRNKKTEDVIIKVNSPGINEARVTAKNKAKQLYKKNLASMMIHKVELIS